MASEKDQKQIDAQGNVSAKRRFDKRDWDYIAEHIIEEYKRRKGNRKHLEAHWADIDRQIAMQPDTRGKQLPDGTPDLTKLWMAEMELPLQAQALEVLTADARKLLFPDSGPWFAAHAHMTDAYLDRVDFQSIILGDSAEVPSAINQDNADKLSEGYILHQLRQYDFFSRMDRINAEVFKYGCGVARGRIETKNLFIHEARGTVKQSQRIPILHPASIKNTYLDDTPPSTHSSHAIGELHMSLDWMRYENLALAVSRGSSDPYSEDGGWMSKAMTSIEADKNGMVCVIEAEGDIVVPRKSQRSFVIPNVLITVAIGGPDANGVASRGVIRFRFRKRPYSSYLIFPYHYEGAHDAYPTSPLMKGRPVQMMATDALNRLMDSAALKNAPPVGYDRNDQQFASSGGPLIHPYAQWGTTDEVIVYDKIGGEPSALAAVMSQGISLYAELTGVLPSRLGAQTVSHTTAYAKDAELQRGAVRTVDYVNGVGKGPVTRWLHMAYDMGLRELKPTETIAFYIPSYGGFVEITKRHLPENVDFEWFGAGGPAEAMQKERMKLQSLQLALQMDAIGQQTGRPPVVKMDAAIRQVLRDGGWTDVDVITQLPPTSAQNPALPPPTIEPNPGAQTVALQQLGLAAQ